MKLVDEARQFYKLYSVQAMSAATFIMATWATISDDQKLWFPDWVHHAVHWTTVLVLVGGIFARLVDQSPKTVDPDATDTGAK